MLSRLIHGARSSGDIDRSWRTFSHTARENFHRNWENGRFWWNDPDCVLLDVMLPTVSGLDVCREIRKISEDVPTKAAKRLKDNKALTLYPVQRWWIHGAWVNHTFAPFDNKNIRRAMQIGLDMEEIMDVATDGAFDLQPGFQYPGTPYFQGDLGKGLYNVKNLELAKKLLAEAMLDKEALQVALGRKY